LQRFDRFDLAIGAVIVVLITVIVAIAAPAYAPKGQQIVYLGPVSGPTQDLYVVDLAVDLAGSVPRKLTNSQTGIIGYDVTPDGSKIVYSEVRYAEGDQTGITDLYVWEAAAGKSTLRYECQGAACTGLKWRPDGGAFAFERIDMNTTVGSGAARTWIFALAENTAHPLFKDTQQIGYMPRWSPDGKRIAVFSVSAGGIVVHDFDTGKDHVVAAQQGEVGSFSPDGRWLTFPKIVALGNNQYAVHVMLADLTSAPYMVRPLIPDSEAVSDVEAVWRSDSQGLIVARQPPARKLAQGSALYSVDLATGAATLLVPDEGYEQTNISVNGDLVVFQRIALGDVTARPELWVYHLGTRELKRIAQNGVSPRWLAAPGATER
jgi:Tol biopolymer transport system component